MTLRQQVEYWKNRAEVAEAKLSTLRSPKWAAVKKAHLKKEGACQYCLQKENLNVHHIKPFHVDPKLELVEDNLITLCEHPSRQCHLKVGHLGCWRDYSPNVRQICHMRQKELLTHKL